MESWESCYGHSYPTSAYSHEGIPYSHRPETRGPPCGGDFSSLSEDIDEGVNEYDEEPPYDLDDPDQDPSGLPADGDCKVKLAHSDNV